MPLTFKLTATTNIACGKRTEEAYTYECAAAGAKVRFHAHPTREWQFVILEGERKLATKVINAWAEAGVNQHDYPGGFDEAIATLSI